jgi:hypothetical protein
MGTNGPFGPNTNDLIKAPNRMATVSVHVDVVDTGWTAIVKFKVFGMETDAKAAPLGSAPGDAMQMLNPDGTTDPSTKTGTYSLANVPVNAPDTDPGVNNNWIVVWIISTSDNQFFHVHRLPQTSLSNGWRIMKAP